MEVFLLALSPLLVNVLTQGIKKIRAIKLSENKKEITRYLVVLLSFVVVVLNSWVSGDNVDPGLITGIAQATFAILGSQLTYFFAKNKSAII